MLTAEVLGISVQPVGFTEQQLASRYLFQLTMKVAFTETRTNQLLWSNDALTFTAEYELSTRGNTAIQGAAFLSQERSSFDRISNELFGPEPVSEEAS